MVSRVARVCDLVSGTFQSSSEAASAFYDNFVFTFSVKAQNKHLDVPFRTVSRGSQVPGGGSGSPGGGSGSPRVSSQTVQES